MGIKFLVKFQTLPWCFPTAVGAQIPCGHVRGESPPPTIKVIKSDGSLQTYHRPVNASQLMSEHPKHLICGTDSFYIGHRIPALSESDTLQLGHQYFLLPRHVFQNDLSFVSFARLINPPPAAAGGHPFEFQKTPNGRIRVRISEEFISRRWEEEEEEEEVLCNTPELKKEYSQLVGGGRGGWKPKLETIRESGGHTASFRFRTPKRHGTVSELEGGSNGSFRRCASDSVGFVDKGSSSSSSSSIKVKSSSVKSSRSTKC